MSHVAGVVMTQTVAAAAVNPQGMNVPAGGAVRKHGAAVAVAVAATNTKPVMVIMLASGQPKVVMTLTKCC